LPVTNEQAKRERRGVWTSEKDTSSEIAMSLRPETLQ
jgi:hypothetical protein